MNMRSTTRPSNASSVQRPSSCSGTLLCLAIAAVSATACAGGPVLTQQAEARRLAAAIHVQFTKAADAANRAVMADTDQSSTVAAEEAGRALQAVKSDVEQLKPILNSLGYPDEINHLELFRTRLAEYEALDKEILPLAAENTNVKAQRLSFGPGREAADAFRRALATVAKSPSKNSSRIETLSSQAVTGVLEIQVIQPRHIAEADDQAMSRMEAEMSASEAAAGGRLNALQASVPDSAKAGLSEATAALDRFKSINDEIVKLSRRNSNVRSLALTLGRKRIVTAACDDDLRALGEALARHEFRATR